MTRLILVRHGESNTFVSRRIGGYRTCSGLSPLGRMQAERLRERWECNPEFGADVLMSSNFKRALETAEIIAPALGDLPIEMVDGFGEHDPGPECDGMTYDDFVARYESLDWQTDPLGVGFPGGETVADFHRRVRDELKRTIDRYEGKTIVVCCHGGVVDIALRHALGAPPTGAFDLWTSNTSITEIEMVTPDRWKLGRYNDHAHLAGLEPESARDA